MLTIYALFDAYCKSTLKKILVFEIKKTIFTQVILYKSTFQMGIHDNFHSREDDQKSKLRVEIEKKRVFEMPQLI